MAEKKYFSYVFCILMIPVKKISNLQAGKGGSIEV